MDRPSSDFWRTWACEGADEVPNATPINEASSGGNGFTAVKALILGSALLSSAKRATEEEDDEFDYTPIVVTGTVLMALGAIYAGQVIHSVSSYCLRRLCVHEKEANES